MAEERQEEDVMSDERKEKRAFVGVGQPDR
jgi:hypothetical protein